MAKDRSFVGYIGIGVDVTDRKLAERELGSANQRLSLALQAGRAASWGWDIKSGRNLWFDDTHALLGTTPETHLGSVEEFRDRVHPDRRGRYSYGANDEPERMLGISIDITECRLAEVALAGVSGKLIEAQGLLENLPLDQQVFDDVHRWLSVETFEGCKIPFPYHLSEEEYSKRRTDFIRKKKGVTQSSVL